MKELHDEMIGKARCEREMLSRARHTCAAIVLKLYEKVRIRKSECLLCLPVT